MSQVASQPQDSSAPERGALLIHGDCLNVLRKLDADSVDAVVTDPPAGIEFMGKEWDSFKKKKSTASGQQTATWDSKAEDKKNPYARGATPRYQGKTNESLQGFQDFICEVFTEVYRVLKPGGHAVVWALPRTSHHTAMGLERAGFDIRDNGTYLFHVFGSGFPKSHNVGLAIDKMHGHGSRGRAIPTASSYQACDTERKNKLTSNPVEPYKGKTEDGQRWTGFGTALKPACEFWILARKPLDGTVAENVQEYGTGALNIDGCRVGFASEEDRKKAHENALGPVERSKTTKAIYEGGKQNGGFADTHSPLGRWPAHLILDEGAAALLDEQSGIVSGTPKSYAPQTRRTENAENGGLFNVGKRRGGGQIGDVGGPSRFFYVPKTSKRDKDEGLDHLSERSPGEKTDREDGSAGITPYAGSRGPSRNNHPTVKATDLMRYLCRLVTPPSGLVLDPFMGSGSTGKAALIEGFSFLGIEREAEYVEIARRRIAAELGSDPDFVEDT